MSGLEAPPGVVGVGIDVVAVQRFSDALNRTPALAARLFTEAELRTNSGNRRTATSLAARFAAKEAVAKALGVPRGMDWHHAIVSTLPSGQPELTVVGTVASAAAERGVVGWRLSLSHDAGIAAAVVIALGAT